MTTVNERGEVVARAYVSNEKEAKLGYFAELAEPSRVVTEPTGGCLWLHELLVGDGKEVVVCDPARTKAIAGAKIKNDRLDSHMLAQLLRADLVAEVYTDRELRGIAREHPTAQLLMTIHGAGHILALMLIAVTDDIYRFPSFRHLGSYVGVVSSVHAIGPEVRRGQITKCGFCLLRELLVKAANGVAGGRANRLNVYFRRMEVSGGLR